MMASIASDHQPRSGPAERRPGGAELAAAYREHYRSLVRLASLLIDDVGTCEEVVQDAFVQVWRTAPQLRSPDRLPAYLRSAVLNGARSTLRKRVVRRRHLTSAPDPAPAAETDAMAGDPDHSVLRALRALPVRQREVLALRYYLDLSETDIAETLGISTGSVKTHAHRGLTALAAALEDLR
ncbi:MAG: SigE family RNA polymerase sigma factor [Acidimicrobiales bacterium]